MRIVIVEDNPADVRLFTEALRFSGIDAEVSHVADPMAAVAAIRSGHEPWVPPPDIVFLDLNMPRMSGFDVLSLLRSTPASAAVPVAIFTSSEAPADVDRAAELQANRFIRKPTALQDFFDVVRSTLRDFSPSD